MSITSVIVSSESNGIVYSTDKSRLDVDYVHNWLSSSYWASGIPRSLVVTSIENSVCIGIYKENAQVGFARLVTDGATFAWLADVFVDERHRGQGISKRMMEFIHHLDFVPGLRRFMLATRDAHGLYHHYGFAAPERPDRLMEIVKPEIYKTGKSPAL